MTTQPVGTVKARFSEFLREAEGGEIVVISRNGKPVAALVSAEDVEQLERFKRAGPEAGLAGLAGGWEGSEELVTILRDVRRSYGRAVPELE